MSWIVAMMLMLMSAPQAERFETECGESNGVECPDPLDELDEEENQLLPGEDDGFED